MNTSIINDNLLYLNEWFKINPKLQENLTLNDNYLIYNTEKLDISKFYLPEMLYNEVFRNKLNTDLTSHDLFNIIKLYCQIKEVTNANNNEKNKEAYILSLNILEDNGVKYLVITANNHKQYRYDTPYCEQIMKVYNELKMEKGIITIKEMGKLVNDVK